MNPNGRPLKYNAINLRKKINDYFNYIDNNPIKKIKTESYKGEVKEYIEYIKRPYLIQGLCIHLDITLATLKNYEKSPELLKVITCAREKIYNNKMEGATAGIFNSNIVALDLGLKAKEEQTINNIILPLGSTEIRQITQDLSSIYGKLPEPEPEIIDITEGNEQK